MKKKYGEKTLNIENDIQQDVKNITIRGVDLEAYNEFSNKLKDFNMNVGDAFNRIIGDVMQDFDQVFSEKTSQNYYAKKKKLPKLSISSHDELSISSEDLTQTKSAVSFSRIGQLKFEDSLTKEEFLTHIKYISNCGLVMFPKTIPKLLALAHCEHCEEIKFYD